MDESTILFLCTLERLLTQFFLQCNQWFYDRLKFSFLLLLLLERTFGWALSPSLCSFLLAFHLEWSFNTNVDKKSRPVFHIFKLVLCFSFVVQIKYFFSLVLISVGIHKRREEKLTRKKLNLDRQIFKDVIWIFWCYSVQPNCRGKAPILRKNCHSFHPFPFINNPSK